ncbi:MAG: cytochrome c [Candidatus Korobacteraceae bacterium]
MPMRFFSCALLVASFLAILGCNSAERPTAEKTAAPAVSAADAKLERGRYLAENLADCESCHSEFNWETDPPEPLPGRLGSGAPFPLEGLPFPVYVPNISSHKTMGAGGWTDEQLARAIREGIGHDGRVLSPIMPYMNFRALSDNDVAAVIAYVRTYPSVDKPTVTPTIPEPVRKQLPQPPPLAKPVPDPDRSDPVKYGQYLVSVAACIDCHTPLSPKMEPMMELAFSGGQPINGPWGKAASANITPDASGISYYDEKMFLEMLRTGHVKARKLNPIMPYWRFRNLDESDQKAIFAYLRTLKPVKHRVDNTEAPTKCKVCGGVHGAGELN